MKLTPTQRVLAYATGAYGLGINAVTAFLVPLRADELGAGLGLIGVLVSAKAIVEAAGSVPVGTFMDRIGPRRSIMLGSAGTALVGIGFLLTGSLVALAIAQLLLGAFRPLAWVGGQSYTASIRDGEDRKTDTGRFSFAANLGQIAGPLLGGIVVGVFGTQAAFSVIVGYGIVFLLLAAVLPELDRPNVGVAAGAGFGAAGRLMALPKVQTVMLLTFCRLWIPAVWSSFYPLLLVNEGVAPAVAGVVVSGMAVAATVTSLLTGRIAQLGSAVAVTGVALAVSLLGVAISPLVTAGAWPLLAASLVGFGQGISLPMLITLMSDAAPAGQRSLALSLRAGVNQASATVAPVAIGPLLGAAGATVGFPVAAALGAGFLVAAVMVARREAQRA